MKIFAIFLPQFHKIKENDLWWGDGFTEWRHVKNAKPLFKDHEQPKVPLDDNYYDLMDKDTVIWQTNLLKKYNIEGLVYYHYYFNGKLLLEKPAENLLKWKDVNQKFFFCWANHSWFKSINNNKTLLIEQTYGNICDWEKHFQYLLKFFNDNRYEKKNNKPIFMLYDSYFKEKSEIFEYFDKRCKENGFNGLYLIETYRDIPDKFHIKKFKKQFSNCTSLISLREPSIGKAIYNILHPFKRIYNKLIRMGLIIDPVPVFSGNDIYDLISNKRLGQHFGIDISHNIFFEWDNTPRHKNRGYIITAPDKNHFDKFINTIKDSEYIFINAWNEWAEGMILEPTIKNGYKYLEWIRDIH